MTPTSITKEQLFSIIRSEQDRAADAERRKAEAEGDLRVAQENIAAAQSLLRNLLGDNSEHVSGISTTSSVAEGNGKPNYGEMSVAEIARLILAASPGLTTNEVTAAMMRKGKVFTTSKPRNTVAAILNRNQDKFVRRGKKWYVTQSA